MSVATDIATKVAISRLKTSKVFLIVAAAAAAIILLIAVRVASRDG